jgi:very-short-patch-repair endonuclease
MTRRPDDDRARASLLVAGGWTLLRFTSRSSDAEIVPA